MSAREVSFTLRQTLIDSIFGDGCYEDPSKLLVNPDEPDEKKWQRKPAIAKFTADSVKDFTEEDLADILNDAADRWAGWRVSNRKATIRNAGRESVTKMVESVILTAVSDFNTKGDETYLMKLIDSNIGTTEIIRVCTRNRVMVPKHPLFTK